MNRLNVWFLMAFVTSSCATADTPLDEYEELSPATILHVPDPGTTNMSAAQREAAARGEYLVELLGCASCHSDGALIGAPVGGRALAGSSIGIAYSNPLAGRHPGVVYPSNLTPDRETGLGSRTDLEISLAIRTGVDRHGAMRTPVMPWAGYAKLTESDANAIVAYLRSIEPVNHRVPANVRPGRKARDPFVYFGIYRSREAMPKEAE